MVYVPESSCSYHRAICPARFCSPDFAPHGWDILCGDGLPSGHDVFVLHGIPSPAGLYALMNHRRMGSKIVWSVDDDYTTLPKWNPVKIGPDDLTTFSILRETADFILTSTPHLANTFADCGDRVFYAPNLHDLKKFPTPKTRTEGGTTYLTGEDKVKLPVRVVWAGGPTHSADIEVVADALDRLLSKLGPSKMMVSFFGMAPPAKILTKHLGRGLIHQPQVPFAAYQQVLNSMDAHVYLCPLSPVAFNLSKSALRVTESWGLCAAPVATGWGEYNLITNGEDGRLVHSPEEWESALTRMVTDHEYRWRCAASGRVRCEHFHDWNNPVCRVRWNTFFEKVTGVTL